MKKQKDAIEISILVVMVVFAVISRSIFAFTPHFKPVSAIVVITGIWLGAKNGFVCGALAALISNFLFGQGLWTPFQMMAWGLIGLFAGLFSRALVKNKFLLILYGVLAGIFYSLILDIATVLLMDRYFNLSRYIVVLASSLPVMAVYAVSNALFLMVLATPIGRKLERVKMKYGF